jgi:hypothetical protein
MRNFSGLFQTIRQLASILIKLSADAWCFLVLCLRPAPAFAAENLFLRKQLALYEERQVKPRRATHATRLAMVWLSHVFDWRPVLRIVKPDTFTGWHRQGFRLFWRWKSQPGRPALPKDLRALIRRMALESPTWGNGSTTTMRAGPTSHWDSASRNQALRCRYRFRRLGTDFQWVNASWRALSWAVCIRNMGFKNRQHDNEPHVLRGI